MCEIIAHPREGIASTIQDKQSRKATIVTNVELVMVDLRDD